MQRLTPWLVRMAGLTIITLAGYFLLFDVLGKQDISWALPWKSLRSLWPDLPVFASWQHATPDGRQEVIYSVPSRQLTRQEIAQLKYQPPPTNAASATSPAAR